MCSIWVWCAFVPQHNGLCWPRINQDLQSDQHWNCFKSNIGETSDRRCSDTILELNWTELFCFAYVKLLCLWSLFSGLFSARALVSGLLFWIKERWLFKKQKQNKNTKTFLAEVLYNGRDAPLSLKGWPEDAEIKDPSGGSPGLSKVPSF